MIVPTTCSVYRAADRGAAASEQQVPARDADAAGGQRPAAQPQAGEREPRAGDHQVSDVTTSERERERASSRRSSGQ